MTPTYERQTFSILNFLATVLLVAFTTFFGLHLQQVHLCGPLCQSLSGVTRPFNRHLRSLKPFHHQGPFLPRDGALLPSFLPFTPVGGF